MTAVLYLHGFASSPASAKIGLLRGRVEPGIVLHTPDLNVPSFERLDFDAAVAHAEATGRGADAPIHRAFFEEMAEVDVDRDPPPSRVIAIMGTKDGSVPFEQVVRVWKSWEPRLVPGSELITIEGGDHGLTAYGDVIEGALRA